MTAPPPNGDAQAIGRLRADLDGAMGVMRDNMRNMAERDVQLQDLEGKSNTLHVASGTFSAHATRLRKEQEWQRCKTRLAIISVVLFLIWILIFIFIGERMTFLIISAVLLAIILPLTWCGIRSLSATSTQSECRKVVGGSEGAAPLSTWGETKKFGDPNLASMVTKDMGMGQRSKPIITLQFWEPEYHETLDLGSQVGLGQRFAVAPSPRVTSLNWAMRKKSSRIRPGLETHDLGLGH